MTDTEPAKRRASVFISYARRDASPAAHTIVEKLGELGFDAYLDEKDIAPGEDWRTRLADLVRAADAIVFIITPASVASEACRWEISEAERLSKRLLPVLLLPTPEEQIPVAWSSRNYIFLDGSKPVQVEFRKLCEAITTDIAWVREHTRLGAQAERWHTRKRTSALLLRGNELQTAERWMVNQPVGAPQPSPVVRQLIADSRKAQIGSTRRLVLSAIVALIVTSALATYSTLKSIESANLTEETRVLAEAESKQKSIAEQRLGQTLTAQSHLLAGLARQQRENNDNGDVAALLALEALPDDTAAVVRPHVLTAEYELHTALSELRERLVVDVGKPDVTGVAYADQGRRIVVTLHDGGLRVFEAASGRMVAELGAPEGANEQSTFRIAGTGNIAARTRRNDKETRLEVWDITAQKRLLEIASHSAMALSNDGKLVLAIDSARQAKVLDITTGKFIAVLKEAKDTTEAVFSPDGSRLVTSGTTTLLWNTSSYSRPIAPLRGIAIAFSGNGERIVSQTMQATKREALAWDARTGRSIGKPIELEGTEDVGEPGNISFDGRRAAYATPSGEAWILDIPSGKILKKLKGAKLPDHADPINNISISISNDGLRLLTLGQPTDPPSLRIWDIESGNQIFSDGRDRRVIRSAVLSPNGREILLHDRDGSVRIVRIFKGEPLIELDGAAAVITHSQVRMPNWYKSDDDRRVVVTVSHEKLGRQGALWNAETGKGMGMLATVGWPTISQDSRRIATVSATNEVTLWDAHSGKAIVKLPSKTRVLDLSFGANSKRLVTRTEDATSLWDSTSGELSGQLAQGLAHTWWHPDGRTILVKEKGKPIRLINSVTGVLIGILQGTEQEVDDVKFDAKGERLLISRDWRSQLWDVGTGVKIAEFGVPLADADKMTGRDATRFVAGDILVLRREYNGYRVWDAKTGNQLQEFLFDGNPGEFAVSSSGEFIVAGMRPELLNVKTGARIALPGFEAENDPGRFAFSADGLRVAVGGRLATGSIFEVATGRLLATLESPTGPQQVFEFRVGSEPVCNFYFNPRGDRLVCAAGSEAMALWDATTGAMLSFHQIPGKLDEQLQAKFTDDGTRFITFGPNGAHYWDTATGALLASVVSPDDEVFENRLTPMFSKDMKRAITMRNDSAMGVWPGFMSIQELVDLARSRLGRCLTAHERQKFYLDPQPPRWCITGAGREREKDPGKWTGLWPYTGSEWRTWLSQADAATAANKPAPPLPRSHKAIVVR